MKNKLYIILMGVLVLGLVTFIVFLNSGKKTETQPVAQNATTTKQVASKTVEYKNTEYGFTFSLPKSWDGYTIIQDEWEGFSLDPAKQSAVTERGPLVSIRHPDWDYKSPYQDIPIMVFTLKQWNDMQAEKFHIGAAPINPSELGRNKKYVFALPARYNFADAVGIEEVSQIIDSKPLHTF